MYRFTRNLALFAIFCILLVAAQFYLIRVLLLKSIDFNIGQEKRVLILGDSQSECDINDELERSWINLSSSGDPLMFNYIKLRKVFRENPQIDTIVLAFSPNSLMSEGIYEVPKIKNKIKSYHYIMNGYDYFDILKFNPKGFVLGITGLYTGVKKVNFFNRHNFRDMEIGKFRPMPIDSFKVKELIVNDNPHEDYLSIKYFDRIVSFCKTNNLRLIVINTPVHPILYNRIQNEKSVYDSFMSRYSEDIIFMDLERLPFEQKYFYDENHFNADGATLFTTWLSGRL